MKKEKEDYGIKKELADFFARRPSFADKEFQERSLKNIERRLFTCPTEDEIKRFLRGDISIGLLAIAMIKRHLYECDSCKLSFQQIAAK